MSENKKTVGSYSEEERVIKQKEWSKKAFENYQKKMVTITFRYPNTLETEQFSLSDRIRARAKQIAETEHREDLIDKRTKDGSVNSYLMYLIEKDLKLDLKALAQSMEE